MKKTFIIGLLFIFSCSPENQKISENPYIMVLGITQDAGYPQMNCKKKCCESAWKNPKLQRTTSCLAIVDPNTNQQWIIDATPNIKEQLQLLKRTTQTEKVDGVLLTHAHMGHYTGLMHFGKEVMGSSKVPVFAMPRMTRMAWEKMEKIM